MTTPKAIQLVARLNQTVVGNAEVVDGNGNTGNGCRSFVISRLKPIIIEPPRPTSQNHIVLLDSDESSDYESVISTSETNQPKRARLTNLTTEEKIMRRKLKNRVSAQTARDRKKQRMAELEEAIAVLQQQNKILEAENLALKSKTESLLKENKDLKQHIQGTAGHNLDVPKSTIIIESPKPQIIHVQKKRKLDSDDTSCLSSSNRVLKDVTILPKPLNTLSLNSKPTKVVGIANIPNRSISPLISEESVVQSDKSQGSKVTVTLLDKSSEQPCESAAGVALLDGTPASGRHIFHRLDLDRNLVGNFLGEVQTLKVCPQAGGFAPGQQFSEQEEVSMETEKMGEEALDFEEVVGPTSEELESLSEFIRFADLSNLQEVKTESEESLVLNDDGLFTLSQATSEMSSNDLGNETFFDIDSVLQFSTALERTFDESPFLNNEGKGSHLKTSGSSPGTPLSDGLFAAADHEISLDLQETVPVDDRNLFHDLVKDAGYSSEGDSIAYDDGLSPRPPSSESSFTANDVSIEMELPTGFEDDPEQGIFDFSWMDGTTLCW